MSDQQKQIVRLAVLKYMRSMAEFGQAIRNAQQSLENGFRLIGEAANNDDDTVIEP